MNIAAVRHALAGVVAAWRNHRARLQWAVLLLLLSRVGRPYLRRWALRLHFRAAAERPRLHFQLTPENERLLSRCAIMTKEKYYPPWYLFNGHLQTLQLAREMKHSHPRVLYERQILDMPDGGIISLDWALPARADHTIPRVSDVDPRRRTMLMLPGLTGGSDEFYIRCVVQRMVALGWQVVVMNARGCAHTPLKTPQFFCVAYTEDLRYVVQYFHDKYNFLADAFVVLGFSLGSNVLVKYLGEERDRAPELVSAGISVGNPFDVVECSRNLASSFFYRNTYNVTLNQNLKELFFHKSNAHEVFKHHPALDLASLQDAQTLTEFDDRLTRIVFNYESVHHFYTDASSCSRIRNVRVPLLCVNAEDDPISTKAAIPYDEARQNPHVILCVTKAGGHLAFYEGERTSGEATGKREVGETGGDSVAPVWSAKVVAEFAESVRVREHERRSRGRSHAEGS